MCVRVRGSRCCRDARSATTNNGPQRWGPKSAGDLKLLRGEVECGVESGREQAHTVCRSGSVWDAAPGDVKETPRGESWEGEAWRVLGDGPRSGEVVHLRRFPPPHPHGTVSNHPLNPIRHCCPRSLSAPFQAPP